MRSGGGLAIVLGACLGIALAFARRSGEPPAPARPALIVKSVSNAAPTPPLPPVSSELPVPPVSSELPVPPVSSELPVPTVPSELPVPTELPALELPPPPASASAAAVLPFPTPTPPTAPATAKELERAEVRCYDKLPDECERSASAYETGAFGPVDHARAEKLRKVALTFLVRSCEKRSPHACFVLASRYKMGAGVPASDRKANALLEHARGLCQKKPSPECVDGEPR